MIAGEISGDQYAYELSKAIQSNHPDIHIIGIGGSKLASIADIFLDDPTTDHVIGMLERFFQPKAIRKTLAILDRFLSNHPIDAAVIIDFGELSFAFGELLAKYHIPVLTFITPNFWLWKSRLKVKKLMRYSQHIVTIFPEEYQFYRSLQAPVSFFGHPLVTQIPTTATSPIPKTRSIGLFPGSRNQELDCLLEPILQTAEILLKQDPSIQIYLSISNKLFYDRIWKAILAHRLDLSIQIVLDHPQEVYKLSKVIITAAGTVSLEAMLYHRPIIVLGALSPLTYWICTHILRLKIPFVSLPNIVTQSPCVPEFIQSQIIPKNIAKTAMDLLETAQKPEWSKKFQTIRTLLSTGKNPFEETARLIHQIIHK